MADNGDLIRQRLVYSEARRLKAKIDAFLEVHMNDLATLSKYEIDSVMGISINAQVIKQFKNIIIISSLDWDTALVHTVDMNFNIFVGGLHNKISGNNANANEKIIDSVLQGQFGKDFSVLIRDMCLFCRNKDFSKRKVS